MKKIFITIITLIATFSFAMGQCFPDRHNTTWYDGWISCDAALNPNETHGLSHWILYDFQQKVVINGMHIWNSNVYDFLDMGIKSAVIDYSLDGESWQELNTYEFAQASGLNTYEGFDLEYFDSFKARYLLLTALSNYGSACYGLSEIRFNMDSTSSINNNSDPNGCFAAIVYPNPFRYKTTLKISVQCNKQTSWFITDSYGRQVISESAIPTPTQQNISVDGTNWNAGIYILTIRQEKKTKQYKLVKLIP